MAMVTTIIPTFRRPHLLQRAICSALAQTYDAVSVAVYDNASGDKTGSVVAEIAARDSRVTYYCHPQQVPVAENFAFGMQRVQTPYFSFLSDDDVIFPNFYASALAALREEPDAVFAAGSTLEFDESGKVRFAPLALWQREGRYTPPEGFLAILGNRHPTFTGVLFKREVIDKVGLLDGEVAGPADLDYELRIASRYPYTVFFEPSAGYLHHADRLSSVEDVSVINGFTRILNKLNEDARIAPALRAAIPGLLERQIRNKLYEIAVKSIVAGRDENAIAAARLLRERSSAGALAAAIEAAVRASSRVPALRRAMASMESMRLRRRAAHTRRRLLDTIGQDGSAYARFMVQST